jgi:hypothetical protein
MRFRQGGWQINFAKTQTVTSPIYIKFIWREENTGGSYSLDIVVSANGSVLKNQIAQTNEYVLTATPTAYGYGLDHWEYKGESTGSEWEIATDSYGKSKYTVTIDEDREYKAVFGEKFFEITETAKATLFSEITYGYQTLYLDKGYGNNNISNSQIPAIGSPGLIQIDYAQPSGIKFTEPDSHTLAIKVYSGESTGGDVIWDRDIRPQDAKSFFGNAGDSRITLYFPEFPYLEDGKLTVAFTVSGDLYGEGETTVTDEKTVTLPGYVSGGNGDERKAAVAALAEFYEAYENKTHYDDPNTDTNESEYLRWKWLLEASYKSGRVAIQSADGVDGINAALAAAKQDLQQIVANQKTRGTDYDEVVFFISNVGNPTMVAIPKGWTQFEAMQAALEQQFPEGNPLGSWYIDIHSGFINQIGVDPTKTRSGVVDTRLGFFGNITHTVNGFFANFGIMGWHVSDGEYYRWASGLSANSPQAVPAIVGVTAGGQLANYALAYLLREGVSPEDLSAYNNSLAADIISAYEASYSRDGMTWHRPPAESIEWNPQYAAAMGGGGTTPTPGGGSDTPVEDYAAALSDTLAYILADTVPVVGSEGGEWAALALARGGVIDAQDAWTQKYLSALDTALAGNASGTTSVTDKARITLALTSLGIDASAYTGKDGGNAAVDLTANLITYDGDALINAKNYSLIALSSMPYSGDRAAFVEGVLAAQLENGGWAQSEMTADVDTTAMAIQALAPYYMAYDAETGEMLNKAAIEKGLAWLKTQQDSTTGGFKGFYNSVSTCSAAQVVTALCALGIDPAGAEWAVSDGKNPLTAMFAWYNAENSYFGETETSKSVMATEQAAYALVAYERMLAGQNPLYVMSDAFTLSSDAGASVTVYYGVGNENSVTATPGAGNTFTAELPYNKTPLAENGIAVVPSHRRATVGEVTSAENGWTFTVTAQDGTPQTYTLAVTNAANPAADNEAAVDAAKAAIEAVPSWTVDMQTANDDTTVKTWLEAELEKLDLGGVAASVTVNTVTSATAGAAGDRAAKNGAPGSFAAAVALTIGENTTLATGSAAITAVKTIITPAVYVSTDASAVSVTVGNKTVSLTPGTLNFDVVLDYAENAELPTEISAEAVTTADADATVSAPATQDNGATWTFTVTAEDAVATATYTINVSIASDPAEGNKSDIGTAKNTIEAHSWTVPADVADVDVWIAGQLEALSLNGVTATPEPASVTSATPGTPVAPDGAPGSFTATVALEKGEEEARATGSATISGTILAIPYVFSTDTGIASVTVQGVEAELTAYALSVTLPHTAQPVVISDIIVETTDEKAYYEIEQGANGAWAIKVTAENPAITVTYTLTVTILANPNAANAATVAEAAAYLGEAMFSVPMSTANDDAEISAWLATRLTAMQLGGAAFTVDEVSVTPAEAGTAEAPSGTPGGFTATVSLTKGAGEALATGAASVAGTITTTPFKQGGGTVTDKQITVTFRLIGATFSENDVDMRQELGNWQKSGYQTWIATRSYTMYEGQTNYDLFVRALGDAGLTSVGQDKNYVETIYAPAAFGGYKLSEFTNGKFSGWMYTVKRAGSQQRLHVGYGLKEQPLYDGDEVIWHYVSDYRFEVNDWFNDPGYPALGDAGTWNKWLEATDVNPSQGSVPTTPSTGEPDASDETEESTESSETPLGGSGGGNIVAAEIVTAEATTENGKVTAAVAADTVAEAAAKAKEAVETAKTNGDTNAQAEVKIIAKADGATGAVKSAEVDIPAEAVKAVADVQDLVLTIESDVSTLTLDAATLTAIAETAKDGDTVKIAAEIGDDSVVDLTIIVGGAAITNLGGEVTVSLPYTPEASTVPADYDLLTVYYLDDDGNITEMKGAKYDAATGNSTFETDHLGKFFVSEWISPFDDISKGEWYYKAARYAYSNDLITGTTDTTFAPQTTLTRAMLITILARDSGIDTSGGDTWYSKAVDWGTGNGLTDGTNMDAPITREQFATLLYRYAQWSSAVGGGVPDAPPSSNADLSGFADADGVSEYAREAMAWAVASGLVTGRTATTLAPKGPATRAEAATLLQRYLENIG